MENTPIIHAPDVLLPHLPILGPEHQVCSQPLEHGATPANGIAHVALPLDLLQ